MIYLILSIAYLIISKGRYSLSKLLFFLLLVSSVAAILIGRPPKLEFEDLPYIAFIAIMLFILFNSYNNYSNIKRVDFDSLNKERINVIELPIIVLGVTGLLLSIYVLYKVSGLLLLGKFTVSEFKNEGGAEETFTLFVPRILITYVRLVAILGYFYLSMHFWYLLQKEYKKSIVYLIISLISITTGMLILSRSATMMYIITYISFFYIISPLVDEKFKTRLLKWLLIAGGLVFFMLYIISSNKFSESSGNISQIALNRGITNPIIYSFFDYYGMWQEHSVTVLKDFRGELFWGDYTIAMPSWIKSKFVDANYNDKLYDLMMLRLGDHWYEFQGLIARIVYDFGYIGTVIFIVGISFVIKKINKQKGVLGFADFVALPIIIPYAACFFAGSQMAYITENYAIILNLILFKYLAFKPKYKKRWQRKFTLA